MTEHARIRKAGAPRRPSLRASRRRKRSAARYFAFLSYSHKDDALADWLHRELEQFRVPTALVGRITEHGAIPRRLTPIFRDERELAAADDLGDEIEGALANSQFLIVLCSPHAARSHWTNAEIDRFKRSRPDGCILAVIAAGEPFASEVAGSEAEECFPPALRHRYDRLGRPTTKRAEPLAADLRGESAARRSGFLKLVAGMLGVGLDELVQRETTRRQRRLAFVASASLAGMVLTSLLAVTAIQARDDARDERREAEGLVAFMLGDLKDKLEPIGRLDALDGVGAKVLDYYRKQEASGLPDNALLQRARALVLMGQVANQRGESQSAMRFYHEAMAGTAEAIRREPDDPGRLYDHAQNVFWVGFLNLELGDLPNAEAGMREYKALAERMVALDPDNMKWRMEQQNAEANLGAVLYQRRDFTKAAERFEQALVLVRAFAAANPSNTQYQLSLVDAQAWLADALLADGNLPGATRLREEQVALLERLATAPTANVEYRQRLVHAEAMLGSLYFMLGQTGRALPLFDASLDNAERLIATEPENVRWRNQAMVSRFAFAGNLLRAGRANNAAPHIEAGCALDEALLARNRHYTSWLSGARTCWTFRARLAILRNETGPAVELANKAVAAARNVKSVDPVSDRHELSEAYLVLGDAQRASGNSAAATSSWRTAVEILPRAAHEMPSEMEHRINALERVGRTGEARNLTKRINQMGLRRTT